MAPPRYPADSKRSVAKSIASVILILGALFLLAFLYSSFLGPHNPQAPHETTVEKTVPGETTIHTIHYYHHIREPYPVEVTVPVDRPYPVEHTVYVPTATSSSDSVNAASSAPVSSAAPAVAPRSAPQPLETTSEGSSSSCAEAIAGGAHAKSC